MNKILLTMIALGLGASVSLMAQGQGQGQRPANQPRGGGQSGEVAPNGSKDTKPPRGGREGAEERLEQGRKAAEAEKEEARGQVERERQRATERQREGAFSPEDRERIEALPKSSLPPGIQRRIDEGKGMPPGLERRVESGKGLPSGWQRRLEVGQRIDKELQSNATAVPREMRRMLPTPPRGQEDLIIGDRLVRVDRRSREIVDTVELGQE
jgi:hypothetical protein